MRKVILNMAISLDGYVCDDNGGFDWIKGMVKTMGMKPTTFLSL